MPKNEEIEEKNDKIVEEEKISEETASTVKKSKSNKVKTTETKINIIESKEEKDSKETKKESEAKQAKVSEKIETESTEKESNNQVDEDSVIEKIKNFIAKIAAMQEEARREAQTEKEEKEDIDKEEKASKSKTNKKSEKEEKTKKVEYMPEYYDLPYRYNETVVKILAQTPKRMFVYWDISDNDREKYVKTFGKDFFEKTYPVLLLYNEDKKYIKEIPINDFANSWYIEIQDPKTKYTIQLGRKFKTYNEIVNINIQKVQENNIILHTDYLPIANSNMLEVPNDHVLLEQLPDFVVFRNVKTNQEITKDLKNFKAAFGNNYGVKEFYEENYKDELSEGMFDMANPSSNLSSSSFK